MFSVPLNSDSDVVVCSFINTAGDSVHIQGFLLRSFYLEPFSVLHSFTHRTETPVRLREEMF